MTQNARVVTVKQQSVVVRVVRKGACGDNCSMCGSCRSQEIEIEADCDIAVNTGDLVCIYSESATILFGLFCLFILPIVLPLTCYFVMQSFVSELYSGIGAAIMLLLSIVIICILNKSGRFSAKARARVVCKL